MNKEIVLPPHMRCASHTINLIAVKDSGKALQVTSLKSVWRQTFSKLQGLWNEQNMSTISADVVKDQFGVYLKSPNVTRWNSTFDACHQLKILINSPQGIDKLYSVCDILGILRLQRSEIIFLREYVDVMKPLAKALDLLQRENNMYMGYLLPILYQTVATLKEFQESKQLQYCLPLACVLIEHIKLRFGSIWWKRSLVIASCIHPRFKMNWIEPSKREEAYQWILDELHANYTDTMETVLVNSPISLENEEDDFFKFPVSARSNEETDCKNHLDKFLEDPARDLTLLNNFAALKYVFIKYNTSLPSSASVERLFSIAADVFKTKRYALTDKNFENQLLLNVNKEYH